MYIPKLIAHRGASAYAPENTLAAFKKAHELGAKMIEFDIMLTIDDVAVVIHDQDIKRTTDGRGLVKDFTFEALENFNACKRFKRDYPNEKIPSLQAVLTFLSDHQIAANIEVKPSKGLEQETVVRVLADINQYYPDNSLPILMSSFNYDVLCLIREYAPEIPLGFLMDEWLDDWHQRASVIECETINANYKILTRSRIASIKEKGYKLLSYTVNRTRKAQKLLDWGVDGIFTDYPDLLI